MQLASIAARTRVTLTAMPWGKCTAADSLLREHCKSICSMSSFLFSFHVPEAHFRSPIFSQPYTATAVAMEGKEVSLDGSYQTHYSRDPSSYPVASLHHLEPFWTIKNSTPLPPAGRGRSLPSAGIRPGGGPLITAVSLNGYRPLRGDGRSPGYKMGTRSIFSLASSTDGELMRQGNTSIFPPSST